MSITRETFGESRSALVIFRSMLLVLTATPTPSSTPRYTPTNTATPATTFTPTAAATSTPPPTVTPSPTSYRVVDLSVSVENSADPVMPGQTFQYMVSVRNHGPAIAPGAIVEGELSSSGEVTFTGDYSWSAPIQPNSSCQVDDTSFHCFIPFLGAAIANFETVVDDSASATQVSLCSEIRFYPQHGSGHDSDPSNNHDCEETTIAEAVQIYLPLLLKLP